VESGHYISQQKIIKIPGLSNEYINTVIIKKVCFKKKCLSLFILVVFNYCVLT